MDKPRWPTLTYEYPYKPAEHATTLKNDFRAVRRYLTKSGAVAVPKYLFKLLYASYVELSSKLLIRLWKGQPFIKKRLEPLNGPLEEAMRRAATEAIKKHMATIEDQFTTIEHYMGTTRAKGIPKQLFEIIYRSMAGFRSELKTQIFSDDPIEELIGEGLQKEAKEPRTEVAVEPIADPVKEPSKGVSELMSEELGETPNEKELKQQTPMLTPAHEAIRLALATIANGSVGELVVADSDSERVRTAAVTKAQYRWPPDEDETEEEETTDEQPNLGSNAKQNTIQDPRPLENAHSRVIREENANHSGIGGTTYSENLQTFDSVTGCLRVMDTENFGDSLQAACATECGAEGREENNDDGDIGEEDIGERDIGEEDSSGGESEDGKRQNQESEEVLSDYGDEEVLHEKELAAEGTMERPHTQDVKTEETDGEANFRMAVARLRSASPLRSSIRTSQHPHENINEFSPNMYPSELAAYRPNVVIHPSGWINNFGSLPDAAVDTFGVAMLNVKVDSLCLRKSQHRIRAACSLAAQNTSTISSFDSIRYVCWRDSKSVARSTFEIVMVEFATAKQANLAIRWGLLWNGIIHTCRKPARIFKLRQCSRCQGYNHAYTQCSAPLRCAKCAGFHLTRYCCSDIYQCVLCRGGHAAYQRRCPVRQAEQRKLDQDPGLHDTFYQIKDDSEPGVKAESSSHYSSAAEPSLLIPMANEGRIERGQIQDRPCSRSPSLSSEQNKSLKVPPVTSANDLDPNLAPVDPDAILEQLEHLKAIVAQILPTSKAGTTGACSRKRKVLEPLGVDANRSQSSRKRVKSKDISL